MTPSALLDKAADAPDIRDFMLASQDPRPECRAAARQRIALAVAKVILTAPASEGMVAAFYESLKDAADDSPEENWTALATGRLSELADLSPRASSAVTMDSEDRRATPDIGAGETGER